MAFRPGFASLPAGIYVGYADYPRYLNLGILSLQLFQSGIYDIWPYWPGNKSRSGDIVLMVLALTSEMWSEHLGPHTSQEGTFGMLSEPCVLGLCSDPTAYYGQGDVLTLGDCQWPKRPEWKLSFWRVCLSVSHCPQCLGVSLGSLTHPTGSRSVWSPPLRCLPTSQA